jgi:hypothetical protein
MKDICKIMRAECNSQTPITNLPKPFRSKELEKSGAKGLGDTSWDLKGMADDFSRFDPGKQSCRDLKLQDRAAVV